MPRRTKLWKPAGLAGAAVTTAGGAMAFTGLPSTVQHAATPARTAVVGRTAGSNTGAAASLGHAAGVAAALTASAIASGSRRSPFGQHRSFGMSKGGYAARLSAIARSVSAAGPSTMTPARKRIDSLLQESEVVIFSKSTCPFCSQAKGVLQAEGIEYKTLELDSLTPEEMQETQDELRDMTGARTVPRIFVEGKCIGGCDDLVAMQQSGKLAEAIPTGARVTGGPVTQFKIQKSNEEWASELDRQQFYILRQQGTEMPGSHEYDRFMPQKGYFACGACGLPLYSADSKFRSNCGWPVFDKCYYSEDAGGCHVGTKAEWGGMEIVCNRCDSHLGHVFFDSFSVSNPNGERH